MAGIEDFVVEQIISDFQQQAAPQQQTAQQTPTFRIHGTDMSPEQFSNFTAAPVPGQGNIPYHKQQTFGQRAQVEAPKQQQEQARAMQARDASRATIMQGIRGLDPKIQGAILKRLGIDPGALQSQLEQQKELLSYKQQLEAPQNEVANAIKMLLATQGGQQHAQQYALKQQSQQQEMQSRAKTQNIQLIQVLAKLAEQDVSGQLSKSIAPLLISLLQEGGINLAPPSSAENSGIKITRRQ